MDELKGVKILDMYDGEIEKVAYEGEEYLKTGKPIRAGDLLLMKNGNFYQTIRYSGGVAIHRGICFIDVSNYGGGIVFRKKQERLKVGDYAKVVNVSPNHKYKNGDIVKIMEGDGCSTFSLFRCKSVGETNQSFPLYENELVLATDEEVESAKNAEKQKREFGRFKIGMKVRLKSGGGDFPLNGFNNNEIYRVDANDVSLVSRRYILIGDENKGYAKPDQLEIVSDAEAKEYKKWRKIGRKVNEYRVGDIVAYDDSKWFKNKGVGEVIRDTSITDLTRIIAVDCQGDRKGYYLTPEKLTLITPVEARLDREGD